MTEFDNLDVGTEIRFKHGGEIIESGVAEGQISQVIQTSVGKAYTANLSDNCLEEDGDDCYLFVSPDQIITVLDYEIVFEAENWQVVKQDDEYFFDPLTEDMIPIQRSELSDALETMKGDTC